MNSYDIVSGLLIYAYFAVCISVTIILALVFRKIEGKVDLLLKI